MLCLNSGQYDTCKKARKQMEKVLRSLLHCSRTTLLAYFYQNWILWIWIIFLCIVVGLGTSQLMAKIKVNNNSKFQFNNGEKQIVTCTKYSRLRELLWMVTPHLGKSTFAFNFLPRGLISSSFVITEVLESTKYCRVLQVSLYFLYF